jgi:hypothetical protein
VLHTILYFGPFDRNFRDLEAETATYVDVDGRERPVDDASPNVEGLRFRYMECRDKEFVAVGLENLILRAPLLLIPERHTDGKGFFSPPQFGTDSAMRLLVDLAIANPEKRDILARYIRNLQS